MSRIVDSHEVTKGTREAIASAEAEFDERKSELVIDLDSKVQVTDAHARRTKVSSASKVRARRSSP